MDATAIRLLDAADTCLLVAASGGGPLVVPMAQWFDGDAVWMTTVSDSGTVGALDEHSACTLCLPGPRALAVIAGEARIFGLDDPAALAVHAAPISGALAVLALRNATTLLGYAREAVLVPARLRPRNRVVVRVRVVGGTLVVRPEEPPGVAPALPADVPADVRRAVAGERRVTVAHGQGRPEVLPATWNGDLALTGPDRRPLHLPGPVAVTVHAGPEDARGLVLYGTLADGRLTATGATWWRGYDLDSVVLPEAPPPGVVLPD